MKILIVDDSVVYRRGISLAVEGEPDIEVVGTASNGKVALARIKEFNPDVVILDLEMPVMDGLTTLKKIRETDKNIIVLVFSGLSEQGAKITFQALEAGADDFLTKTVGGSTIDESIKALKQELVPKIKQFQSRVIARTMTLNLEAPTNPAPKVNQKITNKPLLQVMPKVIGIGSSTGGPEALKKIFRLFNNDIFIPILIAQHMPPFFTQQFAGMLDNITNITVKEAKNGEQIKPKHCYIAPGDFHMEVKSQPDGDFIYLNQKEKMHFVRPAVDRLFFSMATEFKEKSAVFVLTGMGEDGVRGAKALSEQNVPIYIQSKESSTVWGMPGAIFEADLQDKILELQEVADTINQINFKHRAHKTAA